MKKIKNNLRLFIQFVFTALSNGYVMGFVQGKIFKGKTKVLCLPGLNCYSCPGALGACPVGSFQAVLSDRGYRFSFYVAGILIFFGSVFGRLICGFLCPFGLVQDLIYKIPLPKRLKKRKKLPGDRYLRYLKYAVLVLFVIILPLTVKNDAGSGDPWFCKYICPSGTLFGGIPLAAANESIRSALGALFSWKAAVLVFILTLSAFVYRPFCRYLCPLGAFYSLFNRVSLYRYTVDKEKCTACGKCRKQCKMDISVFETPNSPECIRCGECVKACPHGAVCAGFGKSVKADSELADTKQK